MYEDKPITATVKDHKRYISQVLRNAVAIKDEVLVEYGDVIEETGRFMSYLSNQDEDKEITVSYNDGLNRFEIDEQYLGIDKTSIV